MKQKRHTTEEITRNEYYKIELPIDTAGEWQF